LVDIISECVTVYNVTIKLSKQINVAHSKHAYQARYLLLYSDCIERATEFLEKNAKTFLIFYEIYLQCSEMKSWLCYSYKANVNSLYNFWGCIKTKQKMFRTSKNLFYILAVLLIQQLLDDGHLYICSAATKKHIIVHLV